MAFIFGYSNLVVANNSGAPTQQVDMTADWIVLDDGSGNTLRVPMTTTVPIIKNTTQTSTMVNGRDQAAAFPASTITPVLNVWVSIWAIYNPVTNTIAGLFSLSATAPTLPSGYTHKAWVGAVYSQVTTGNFGTFNQIDNKVACTDIQVLNGGTNTTYTDTLTTPLNTVIPSSAKVVTGRALGISTGSTIGAVQLSPMGNTVGQIIIAVQMASSMATTDFIEAQYRLLVITPQTLWYSVSAVNRKADIHVSGWEY